MISDVEKSMDQFGLKTPREREVAKSVVSILEKMPAGDRADMLRKLTQQFSQNPDFVAASHAVVRDRLDEQTVKKVKLERGIEALKEVRAWTEAGSLKLTQPQGSSWYKLRQAWKDNDVFSAVEDDLDHSLFFKAEPHVIVIEHDWAAAFSGAGDFDAGEFRLPFPACCFEFVMNGKRVLAVMVEQDEIIHMRPFVQTKHGFISGFHYRYAAGEWVCPDGTVTLANEWLAVEICRQVRAASIAMEADAVETEPVDPPAKLNAARAKRGELPLNGYSVIRISKHRRARYEASSEHDEKRRIRCHFRRGHWRHYANHKTWVKWMLVGNPDLGFVNKHYRL